MYIHGCTCLKTFSEICGFVAAVMAGKCPDVSVKTPSGFTSQMLNHSLEQWLLA